GLLANVPVPLANSKRRRMTPRSRTRPGGPPGAAWVGHPGKLSHKCKHRTSGGLGRGEPQRHKDTEQTKEERTRKDGTHRLGPAPANPRDSPFCLLCVFVPLWFASDRSLVFIVRRLLLVLFVFRLFLALFGLLILGFLLLPRRRPVGVGAVADREIDLRRGGG